MKKFVIAGTLVGALALGVSAFAQSTAPAAKQPAGATKQTPATKPAAGTTAEQGTEAKTTPKKKSTKAAAGENAVGHTAPKDQPNTTGDASAPNGAMPLATVRIPSGLKADGKDLPAGTYQVRLTADEAKPDAKGSDQQLERWVEFVKAGKVVGREVVSIVPSGEAKLVQKDTPPKAGGSKVESLKGGDYTRVWINKGGNYYLVHLTK